MDWKLLKFVSGEGWRKSPEWTRRRMMKERERERVGQQNGPVSCYRQDSFRCCHDETMESLVAWRTRDDWSWSFFHQDVCWWEAAHGKNNGWQWHRLEHAWSLSDIQQLSADYYNRPTLAVSYTTNSCHNLLGLGITISVTNDLQIWNDTSSL